MSPDLGRKSRAGERRCYVLLPLSFEWAKKICALFIAPEAIPDDNMEAMAIKENRRDGIVLVRWGSENL